MAKVKPQKPPDGTAKRRTLPAKMREMMFKPGNNANPGGRPKGPGLTSLLRAYVEELDPKTALPYKRLLVEAIVKQGIKGHPVAIKEIWERLEGRVIQHIDVQGETELWQRLNQGRIRITESVQEGDTTVTRSVEYSGPVPETIQTMLEPTEEDLVGFS